MAKVKKSGPKADTSGGSSSSKELDAAMAVFARGDYARARVMLEEKTKDPALSEGAKEEARALIAATRLERGTLYVGLACIALFLLVLIVTAALQP